MHYVGRGALYRRGRCEPRPRWSAPCSTVLDARWELSRGSECCCYVRVLAPAPRRPGAGRTRASEGPAQRTGSPSDSSVGYQLRTEFQGSRRFPEGPPEGSQEGSAKVFRNKLPEGRRGQAFDLRRDAGAPRRRSASRADASRKDSPAATQPRATCGRNTGLFAARRFPTTPWPCLHAPASSGAVPSKSPANVRT
jgi:hypothetical protein